MSALGYILSDVFGDIGKLYYAGRFLGLLGAGDGN